MFWLVVKDEIDVFFTYSVETGKFEKLPTSFTINFIFIQQNLFWAIKRDGLIENVI